jgi:beta-lactam-binding protein with PASTA domain
VRKKGGKRVTKQKPPAGTEVPAGTPVNLTLGS